METTAAENRLSFSVDPTDFLRAVPPVRVRPHRAAGPSARPNDWAVSARSLRSQRVEIPLSSTPGAIYSAAVKRLREASLRAFRLFLSSPGDAGVERERAQTVVSRLNGEFAGLARLETVRWETEHYRRARDLPGPDPAGGRL